MLDSELYCNDIRKALERMDLSGVDNKYVAVTGGMGLIGSALVDMLLIYGKVKGIYILAKSKENFLKRYSGYEKVEFVEYNALEALDFRMKVDYIIHCAGIASPELYVKQPVETMLTNILGVNNLLEYAKNYQVERVLYVSSSEIYGRKENGEAFAENEYGIVSLSEIRSSYPVAKSASEMLCKSYAEQYGVDSVIVRPGHVYGPTVNERDKRISSEFALKAANGDKLIMKSAGMQRRSYCYSVDAAAQILTVLLYGQSGDAYNIGSDSVTSIREMVEVYAKAGAVVSEMVEPIEEEIKRFNPMEHSVLSNDKVKALGYSDSFSSEEGLEHTVKILKEILNSKE